MHEKGEFVEEFAEKRGKSVRAKRKNGRKEQTFFLETVDNSAVLNYNRHILKFNYWRAREAEKQGNMQNSSSERDEKRGSKTGGRAGKTACGDRAMGQPVGFGKRKGENGGAAKQASALIRVGRFGSTNREVFLRRRVMGRHKSIRQSKAEF